MDSHATNSIGPIAVATIQHVQVLANTMRIRDLTIDQPGVIEYLRRIAPNKQEIALVHALEVGITAMQVRRGA